MNRWRARDPVMRFQNLLLAGQWWDAEKEKQLRFNLRKEVKISVVLNMLQLCPHVRALVGVSYNVELTAHVCRS